MTQNPEVDIRVGGDEQSVRQMLAGLHQVADVAEVSAPQRRREGGVQVNARVVPRQRAAGPGETTPLAADPGE
jgi:hypothetical protein